MHSAALCSKRSAYARPCCCADVNAAGHCRTRSGLRVTFEVTTPGMFVVTEGASWRRFDRWSISGGKICLCLFTRIHVVIVTAAGRALFSPLCLFRNPVALVCGHLATGCLPVVDFQMFALITWPVNRDASSLFAHCPLRCVTLHTADLRPSPECASCLLRWPLVTCDLRLRHSISSSIPRPLARAWRIFSCASVAELFLPETDLPKCTVQYYRDLTCEHCNASIATWRNLKQSHFSAFAAPPPIVSSSAPPPPRGIAVRFHFFSVQKGNFHHLSANVD